MIAAIAILLVAVAAPATAAPAQLTVTPLTWDVVGLDSNNVNAGTNVFPVGARVCNPGGSAATDVTASFAWDGAGTVALAVAGASTVNIGTLAGGACSDVTFMVSIPRATVSYNKVRPYHIEASGTGVTTGQTPAGRQLYVEKLVSQNRNSTLRIAGPGGCNASLSTCDPALATPVVGNTYTYKLYGSTATNGYEQLEGYLTFPTSLFRILSAHSDYSVGASRDTVYADACGWEPNPAAAAYRSCQGSGKAGGDVAITYTVLAIAPGSGTLNAMLYDYSGSSYHYNSDYGIAINFGVTVTNPPTATPTPAPTATATPTPAPTATATPTPAPTPTLEADREVTTAGGTVEVCGAEWLPGTDVELSLDGGATLMTVIAGGDGTFCVDLVIPAGTVAGIYRIVANGLDATGDPASRETPLEVLGLPATDVEVDAGASGGGTPGHGLVLLLLGAVCAAALGLRPGSRMR